MGEWIAGVEQTEARQVEGGCELTRCIPDVCAVQISLHLVALPADNAHRTVLRAELAEGVLGLAPGHAHAGGGGRNTALLDTRSNRKVGWREVGQADVGIGESSGSGRCVSLDG